VYSDWNPSPTRRTYASIGDEGVTASVNDYGDIMQFGRYLGAAKSGMFSVDHTEIETPYFVKDRALKLQNLCENRTDISYGMQFDEILDMDPPVVKYFCDRWPRYIYSSERCWVAIQWMVHGETVLQQCIAHNTSDDKFDFTFSFLRGMKIRELEYLDR
jgi:hypothetical protein